MVWPKSVEADIRIADARGGVVAVVPPRKKVAIIGFSATSIHLTPWHDPAWELWGMNQSFSLFERRPDRWFEIHLPNNQPDAAMPSYLNDLAQFTCPVYMIEHTPTIPTSVRYPIERVREGVPPLYHRYFTSSAAYMIALALSESFQTIALYGVDCAIGTEYEVQKPCVEAWGSLAVGRGVELIVPETSSLFKTAFLYGYEPPRAWPRVLKASEHFLRERIQTYKASSNEKLRELHQMEGAIGELEGLLQYAEAKGRGSNFPTVDGTAPHE